MSDSFLAPCSNNRIYYIHIQLRDSILRVAQSHWHGAKLLDYGCGTKPYLQLLNPLVQSYIGADISDNPDADVRISDSGTVDLPNSSVTAILSSQVLEHVPSPQIYLQECSRLLDDAGVLILTTHGYWRYHPHPTDYWRWTNAGLRKIVQENGFEIVEFRGIMSVLATGLQLVQDELRSWIIGVIGSNRIGYKLQSVFTWVMQRLIQWTDSKVPQSSKDQDAAVFMVVARKI